MTEDIRSITLTVVIDTNKATHEQRYDCASIAEAQDALAVLATDLEDLS